MYELPASFPFAWILQSANLSYLKSSHKQSPFRCVLLPAVPKYEDASFPSTRHQETVLANLCGQKTVSHISISSETTQNASNIRVRRSNGDNTSSSIIEQHPERHRRHGVRIMGRWRSLGCKRTASIPITKNIHTRKRHPTCPRGGKTLGTRR